MKTRPSLFDILQMQSYLNVMSEDLRQILLDDHFNNENGINQSATYFAERFGKLQKLVFAFIENVQPDYVDVSDEE